MFLVPGPVLSTEVGPNVCWLNRQVCPTHIRQCGCEHTQPIANTSIFKPEEGKRAPFLYRQVEQPPSYSAPTASLLPLLSDTAGPASVLSPVLRGSLLASSDPAGDSNTDLRGLLLSACEAVSLGP